jgi:hypothetical protein
VPQGLGDKFQVLQKLDYQGVWIMIRRKLFLATMLVSIFSSWSGTSGATVYATANIQFVTGTGVVGTCTNVSTSPNDNNFYNNWHIDNCTMSGSSGFWDYSSLSYRSFLGGSSESTSVVDYAPVDGTYWLGGNHYWEYPSTVVYQPSYTYTYCTVISLYLGAC